MLTRAQRATLASAAVLGLGAAVASATPTVVNFDDIPQTLPQQSSFVPSDYGADSFNWGDGQFFAEADSDYKNNYHNTYGAPSPSNAIANDGGAAVTSIQRIYPFNFTSMDLASFAGFNTYQQQSAVQLTITGLRLGQVVGTKTVALDAAGYHDVIPNWRNIDTVRLTASGSLDPNVSGGYFLMDNFTYTPEVFGDTNDSGKVDFADLLTLAQNYGKSGPGMNWEQGDFNNDHSVNFNDLLILAQHYNTVENAVQFASLSPAMQQDVAAAFAQVPEPASAGVLALVGLGLLARRRNTGK